MVKTKKNNAIRTFCFYSAFHVLCTKDFLKEAKLGASFDSVCRLFHIFAPLLDKPFCPLEEVFLAALGLSQYFVEYTKNQNQQQTYCRGIEEQAHF